MDTQALRAFVAVAEQHSFFVGGGSVAPNAIRRQQTRAATGATARLHAI